MNFITKNLNVCELICLRFGIFHTYKNYYLAFSEAPNSEALVHQD